MDHRKITQLRERARASRSYGEKVLATPDEMDALLDLALAQIEEGREPGGPTAGDYLDDLGGRLNAFARSLGGLPGWTDSPAVQAWHRSDHRTEHDGTPGQPRIWSPDYGTTERWSTPSLRNVHWSDLVDVTPLATEQPRSLTPDDITDEMVERGARQTVEEVGDRWAAIPDRMRNNLRESTRGILTAALTEPPARPEGAEEIQAIIDELFTFSDEDGGPDAAVDLANRMAERGVRVVGSES